MEVLEKTKKTSNENFEQKISFVLKDLDFATFKKIMDTYGVVVCRNALPILELKKVRDMIFQRIFSQMKLGRDLRKDLKLKPDYPRDSILKTMSFLLEGVSDMAEVDKDNIFRGTVENSGIIQLLEKYMAQGKVNWLQPYYYSRTLDPLEEKYKLKLHQDGTFLRSMGEPGQFMICWAPLVTIGEHIPGLELVAKKFDHIFNTAAPEYHGIVMEDENNFLKAHQECVVRPKIQMGDFIMFSPFTPHRTYLTDEMSDIRTSVDFRFYCGNLRSA